MTKVTSIALAGLLGLSVAVASVGATDEPAQTVTVTRTETVRKLQMFQRKPAVWWAKRTWYWKRRSIALKRTLMDRPQVREAINLACVTYAVSCSLMFSIARCESGLYAGAKNRSSTASGLFQMLYPSTWSSTPYWPFSVWSPYASSLAAAHMLAHGRRGEWVC